MRSWLQWRNTSRERSFVLSATVAVASLLLGSVPGVLHAQASPTLALASVVVANVWRFGSAAMSPTAAAE